MTEKVLQEMTEKAFSVLDSYNLVEEAWKMRRDLFSYRETVELLSKKSPEIKDALEMIRGDQLNAYLMNRYGVYFM